MKVGKNARFVVALLIGVAAFAFVVVRLSTQGAQIRALSSALTQEQGAARSEGRTPVAPPPKKIIQSPEAVASAPPPPPPPPVDIDAVVRDVLARIPTPQDGRPGKDAPPPTPRQVSDAVTAVCAAQHCGPTDEQVATQVALYLTAHPPAPGKDGKDGTDGVDGTNGQDGRDGDKGDKGDPGVGIAHVDMTQDGPNCTFVVDLTDGQVLTFPFRCQPDPVPAPSDTPTGEPTDPTTEPPAGGP